MSGLCQRLSLAAVTLVSSGAAENLQAQQSSWQVDTSFLSYVETDDRVSVSKALANLTRANDNASVNVSLVHDTMSGASPTGAIRSSDSAVTYTSASGGSSPGGSDGGDYSKSSFEDTRIQAGLALEQKYNSDLTFSYGGAVSQESDYESFGANLGIAKESSSRLITYNAGLAYTSDTIYRSDTDGTPEPLSNIQFDSTSTKGQRTTVDILLGVTRVLNKQTLAQFNVSASQSNGYHSDPYKIISAADEEDRIMANFHDSRPRSRLRTSAYAQIVHALSDSKHTLRVSYRLYRDDFDIVSHTVNFRYRHQLTRRQYLEPHLRFYRQSDAYFYRRKLDVDEGLNPVIPDSGFASADYRLDAMSSATIGMKYGIFFGKQAELRFRAEYLDQAFSTADYDSNIAVILQTSFKYNF